MTMPPSLGILSVYQVDEDPNHLLLVDQDLYVINGAYSLARRPDDGVMIAQNPGCSLAKAGFIRIMERDVSYWGKRCGGYGQIDYNEVLRRFRDGERASLTACQMCGYDKEEKRSP